MSGDDSILWIVERKGRRSLRWDMVQADVSIVEGVRYVRSHQGRDGGRYRMVPYGPLNVPDEQLPVTVLAANNYTPE